MSAMKRLLVFILLLSSIAFAVGPKEIPDSAQISPQALVRILQSNQSAKLLILNVGPRVLYAQARVRGAEFIGPTSDPRGLAALRQRVKGLPKNKQIILYCGCCPWDRCPNVGPGYTEMKKLGFTNVKVLYIAHNIGMDWVDQGYPTDRRSN